MPPDTLLGISLPAFLAGARDFTMLFEPGERRALQGFFWSNGPLILSILDELKPAFEVLTPSPQGWSRSKLAGLPEIGVVNVWRFDMEEAESNGDLLANAQDPITPATMSLIEPGKAPVVLKRAPRTFSADGLVVARHEAVAIDGERIPYVQVGPPGETGDAPVHHERLRRLRSRAAALLQLGRRQALAGAGRHQRHGQHQGRWRVRHALA